jgi:hypothetical protein
LATLHGAFLPQCLQPRAVKRSELESFWRAHLDGWRRSELNQWEYCELHGLPLKRFGNWRAKLKYEEPTSAGKLLYRRGGGLSHMTKGTVPAPASHIPSTRSTPPGKRRRFSKASKRRIVEEANSILDRRFRELKDLVAEGGELGSNLLCFHFIFREPLPIDLIEINAAG